MDIQLPEKKGIRKKHLPYIIGGAVIIGLVAWIATSDVASTLKIDRRGLNIGSVIDGQFDDFARVDGNVLPISTVQISPEEGGIVREKVVEEGATVKKGDVIIRLSNSNLDLQILNAEAELAEKQNILRNTQISMEQDLLNNRNEKLQIDLDVVQKERAFRQQERLQKERLNSREEYLKAKEDYELAMRRSQLIDQRLQKDSIFRLSQVEQMEDNLANMQRNVVLIRERKEHLNVVSPIDGELGLLDVELGQNVSAGAKVGQINDLSNYKVEAKIDEHYIDRVHTGLEASCEREGKSYNLRLRKVYPEVREGKFRVEFVFDGEYPEKIRSGQTYYLNLQLGQSAKAVLIPRGTFFQTTGGKWIFVLDKDGKKAYRRQIRLGRQNPQYYEVLEGLDPGEKVILNGYEAYKDKEILSIND